MIYILRSSSPLGNEKHQAQFYTGYADDDKFMRRINAHSKGKGSSFTKACCQRGFTLMVMAIFEGTRNDERLVKNYRNVGRIINQLQHGKKPRCITGDILFIQSKCWQDLDCISLPIFAFSLITT